MIKINQDELYLMVVSSVRYALGRMSYIVSDTANFVKKYSDDLTVNHLKTIQRDVQEALDNAENRHQLLGMKCDHKVWISLSDFLNIEIKKRTE